MGGTDATRSLALATEIGLALEQSPARAEALFRLEHAREDLYRATEWFANRREATSAFQLLAVLRFAWVEGHHVGEGRAWLARLLARSALTARTELRARTLDHAGALAFVDADYGAARQQLQESLDIRRDLGAPCPSRSRSIIWRE